jgi:hypothetical protein
MTPIQSAWETLSNSMRLYAESSAKFKQLFSVDAEEAINNHDRAFESKLEAFHRLYDITNTLPGFGYFEHADTSLLICLRNAIHHRDHSLFVSWNAMLHANGAIARKAGAAYLLACYEAVTEETSKYYLPLHDFYARLQHASVRKPSVLRQKWDRDLAFESIAKQGNAERYPNTQIYVNVIPVFISAMQRVVSWLRIAGVSPVGFDGRVYVEHFTELEALDLTKPTYTQLRMPR